MGIYKPYPDPNLTLLNPNLTLELNLQAYMESGQLDLAAKAAYLKELNKSDPGAVLRHMEQQPQLASEAVAAEYIRALVKSGRFAHFWADVV